MIESEPVKRWETFLLYKKYQATGKRLPEEEYKKLVDGLVNIIQNCYENATEPDKIHIFTDSFKKR
mgnify:CR=1 FL=1